MGHSGTSKAASEVARPRPESFESRLDPVARDAWAAGFRVGAFPVPPGVATVPVGGGLCALVDEADAELAHQHAWKAPAFPSGRVAYVSRVGDGELIHRLLVRPRLGLCVDHRNSLVLDNRRSNLREATAAQNAWNTWRPKNELCSSLLFGVSRLRRARGGWLVSTQHFGALVCIGEFVNETEAGWAYDAWCREARGEFALLNFPSLTEPDHV